MDEYLDDMADIRDACDEEGGVLAISLGELRDAVDAGKLGKFVMQRITEELAAHGLGCFPQSLLDPELNTKPRQAQMIRVYRKGPSSTARAVEAVLYPSASGDSFLCDLATDGAQETLARIRELVAPAS